MCLVHLTPGTAADKIGACFAGFLAKQVTLFGGQLLPLVNPFARFGNYNLC